MWIQICVKRYEIMYCDVSSFIIYLKIWIRKWSHKFVKFLRWLLLCFRSRGRGGEGSRQQRNIFLSRIPVFSKFREFSRSGRLTGVLVSDDSRVGRLRRIGWDLVRQRPAGIRRTELLSRLRGLGSDIGRRRRVLLLKVVGFEWRRLVGGQGRGWERDGGGGSVRRRAARNLLRAGGRVVWSRVVGGYLRAAGSRRLWRSVRCVVPGSVSGGGGGWAVGLPVTLGREVSIVGGGGVVVLADSRTWGVSSSGWWGRSETIQILLF